MKKISSFIIIMLCLFGLTFTLHAQQASYSVVDTGQEICYDSSDEITAPDPGEPYYGQDAQFEGNQPDYTDNGDGTITDNVTSLMWTKTCDTDGDGDIDYDDKMSYDEAIASASSVNVGGYSDWRLPSIKEQYSLILFSGIDPSGYEGPTSGLVPFIDTDYFDFAYGDENAGERIIDAQMATTNIYVGTTMGGDETMFGVNFADGRIKGYGTGPMPGQTEDKKFYVYYVRGNTDYGINDLEDNADGTISDNATDLMWTQDDSGEGLNWEETLAWVQQKNTENYLGYSDWRLPNVKELQSIVDYTRAPSTTNSASVDPLFNCTQIIDEGGNDNYPFYWSGTTHANWTEDTGYFGAYVAFGEALGWMEEPPMSGNFTLMDVHGAGAQRSDPKSGDPANWPHGNGPQGDVIRIYNYVRLVRDITTVSINPQQESSSRIEIHKNYPNPAIATTKISFSSKQQVSQPEVTIYNIIGQKLATLSCEQETKEDGYEYYTRWDCKDEAGSSVPNGVYFYHVITDGSILRADKMVISR